MKPFPWLAVVLLLGATNPLAAQERPLAARALGTTLLAGLPGGTVTAAIEVRNPLETDLFAMPVVVLPDGWSRVVALEPIEVAPRGTELWLLPIAIPRNAPAGTHWIRWSLSAGAGTLPVVDSLPVQVQVRSRLEIERTDAPPFAIGRAGYQIAFGVVNRGNAVDTFRFRVTSSLRRPIAEAPTPLILAPGAEGEVHLRLGTLPPPGGHRRELIEILRRASGDARDSAVAALQVEVLPEGKADERPTPDFPVLLATRLTESGRLELPARISGAGPLGPGSDTYLDFMLQRARPAGVLFPERDLYRMGIRTRGAELRIGDQFFALTPLTAMGRIGTGASLRLSTGRVTTNGFVRWDRWRGSTDTILGAALALRLGQRSAVSVQQEFGRGEAPLQLSTLRTRLAVARPLTIDAELGRGGRDTATGTGYSLGVAGELRTFSYEVRHQRTDAAFPLADPGRPTDAARLTFRPWARWRLEGSVNAIDAEGEDGEPIFRSRTTRVSLGYARRALLEYRWAAWSGSGGSFRPERETRTLGLRMEARLGALRLVPAGELGDLRDRTTGTDAAYHRVALQAEVGRSSGSWISAGVERSTQALGVTMNGTARFTAWSQLSLLTTTTLYGSSWQDAHRRMEGRLVLGRPGGHRLTFRTLVASAADRFRLTPQAFDLQYEIPLGIPLPRRGGHGNEVRGRVVDAASGRPLAGIPVRLGDQAVLTDRGGEARFRDLTPGAHELRLDPRALGLGRVPVANAPTVVAVATGAPDRFEIGITAAGRIRGHLVLLPTAPDTLARGLPGIPVEVRGPGGAEVRRTDADGAFTFPEMTPGSYVIRLVPDALPPQHLPTADSVVITLAPGEDHALSLEVRKRERTVHLAPLVDLGLAVAPRGGARLPAATPAPIPVAPRTEGAPADGELFIVDHQTPTLVDVARRVYNDGMLWPKLWLANRAQLRTVDALRPGLVLDVPPLAPLTPAEQEAARHAPSAARRR